MYNISKTVQKIFNSIKPNLGYKMQASQLLKDGVLVAPTPLTVDVIAAAGFPGAKLRNGVVTFTGEEGLPVIAVEMPCLINLKPSDTLYTTSKTIPMGGYSGLAMAQVGSIDRIVRAIYKNVTGNEAPPRGSRDYNLGRPVTGKDLKGAMEFNNAMPDINVRDINAALDYLHAEGNEIQVSKSDILKEANTSFASCSRIMPGWQKEIDRLKAKYKKEGIDIQ